MALIPAIAAHRAQPTVATNKDLSKGGRAPGAAQQGKATPDRAKRQGGKWKGQKTGRYYRHGARTIHRS